MKINREYIANFCLNCKISRSNLKLMKSERSFFLVSCNEILVSAVFVVTLLKKKILFCTYTVILSWKRREQTAFRLSLLEWTTPQGHLIMTSWHSSSSSSNNFDAVDLHCKMYNTEALPPVSSKKPHSKVEKTDTYHLFSAFCGGGKKQIT